MKMTTTMIQPPKPKKYTHATFISRRTPVWKYHTSIGFAKSAIKNSGYGDLYEVDGNDLKLLYEVGHQRGRKTYPWDNEPEVLEKLRRQEISALKSRRMNLMMELEKVEDKLEQLEKRD